ncbi:MAG: FG-GAP repeat protein [Planctomycetota bacterium]
MVNAAFTASVRGVTQDWCEAQKLLASDGAASDLFGLATWISGEVLAIGATGHDDNGEHSGSAYVFRYDGAVWVEEQKLLASDGDVNDRFGAGASVDGEVAVIAARADDDNGAFSGSAYVFRYDGAAWVEEQKLLPSDGGPYDLFGHGLKISGEMVVAGAHLDSDNGEFSGSAYVFTTLNGVCPCPWDLDGSGDVRFPDFIDLLAAWGANPGHPADFDGDGIVGSTDFLILLAAWGPCP